MSTNLTKPSLEKLLSHGYKLIRTSEDGGDRGDKPKIKVSEEYGTWRTLEIFDTKEARDRRALELTKNDCYLCVY